MAPAAQKTCVDIMQPLQCCFEQAGAVRRWQCDLPAMSATQWPPRSMPFWCLTGAAEGPPRCAFLAANIAFKSDMAFPRWCAAYALLLFALRSFPSHSTVARYSLRVYVWIYPRETTRGERPLQAFSGWYRLCPRPTGPTDLASSATQLQSPLIRWLSRELQQLLQMKIDDSRNIASCVECQHSWHAVTGLRAQGLLQRRGQGGECHTLQTAVQRAPFPQCFRSQTYIGKHTNRQHI